MHQQRLTRGGRAYLARQALEQRRAQFLLQVGNLVAERGLHHVAALGGTAGGHCAPPLSGTSREPHSPPTASLAGAADVGRHRPGRRQQLLRATPAAHDRPAVFVVQRDGRRHRHHRAAQLRAGADAAGAAGRHVRTPQPDRADDAAVGWRPLDFVVRHQHRRTAGGHGADRTAVRRRPDPGAVRRHAGGAARTRKGGRYRHERPVAGHSAGPHRRGRTGRCGQLAHGVLGGRDPDDGHVRRPVAPAAAQPEPHVDELSAPVGLDSAHVH
ncbi:hypothetical protein G6F31_014546 [Rhizopus arrhizus]|nr:hypothetical protein G6F31_014546 [Rhizopus arrhizus]